MIQTSLFDTAAATVTAASSFPRKAQIDAAFERADEAFIERYGLVLVIYGKANAAFIAGDVTDYYVKNYGPISDKQKKSLGGLYQRLQRSGVIEKTGGSRMRDQGNLAAEYRLIEVTK